MRARRGDFTACGVAAGIMYWLAVVRFLKTPLSTVQKAWWFWVVAVGLRLAILPVLAGDDLWRYRWEGRIQLHGFNPYQLAPDAPALVPLRDAEWNRISHLNFPAIYPPLTELTFAALAAVKMPVFGYKLLFALIDLGVVFLLRRLLARGPEPPEAAAWYAWNPLAVYAAAGAAHFDGLMVLPLLGAIWLLERAVVENRASAAWGSAALLGVSAAFKIVPLALVPVWWVRAGLAAGRGGRCRWCWQVPVGLAAWSTGFRRCRCSGRWDGSGGSSGSTMPCGGSWTRGCRRAGIGCRPWGRGFARGWRCGGDRDWRRGTLVGDGGGVVAQSRDPRLVRGVGAAAGGVARRDGGAGRGSCGR